ncbi:MAG TPA: hypothetical protein VEQ11_03505 [Chloroflexota bacterium]|nr:hypothetical protein [Chloroflexota bacterium]
MERIFWVRCPECDRRFYADYLLRERDVPLVCPFCQQSFRPSESPEVDERWFA